MRFPLNNPSIYLLSNETWSIPKCFANNQDKMADGRIKIISFPGKKNCMRDIYEIFNKRIKMVDCINSIFQTVSVSNNVIYIYKKTSQAAFYSYLYLYGICSTASISIIIGKNKKPVYFYFLERHEIFKFFKLKV